MQIALVAGAHIAALLAENAALKQEVVGRIDLLVETDERFAIIDHKSFPGRRDLWDAKAAFHGPQLALYADAVASVTGNRCCGTFVHLPLVGMMIEVDGGVAAS